MIRVCRRCNNERKHHARGLCASCYFTTRTARGLDPYPPVGQPVTDSPLVCVCTDPVSERIPWFSDARQCAICARPFADDLARSVAS